MGFTDDNLRMTPKERKELERQKARLYARLAKDVETVARRQKHYAAIAFSERKISDVDAQKAKSQRALIFSKSARKDTENSKKCT
jgi:hypothetical protein